MSGPASFMRTATSKWLLPRSWRARPRPLPHTFPSHPAAPCTAGAACSILNPVTAIEASTTRALVPEQPTIWASAAMGPTAAFVTLSLPAGLKGCSLALMPLGSPGHLGKATHYDLPKAPASHYRLKVN